MKNLRVQGWGEAGGAEGRPLDNNGEGQLGGEAPVGSFSLVFF